MAKSKKKQPRGRPRVQIDLETVEKLGRLQCTYAECSAFLGIPEGTLKKRDDFTTTLKKGAEEGRMSLRRYQFKMAETNPTMAIWLGKQYLQQKDRQELDIGSDVTIEVKIVKNENE